MKRADFIAIGLALIAVFASSMVAKTVYEGLPHLEDEFAFLWEAEVMAEGRISLPTPLEPRSFLVPFVVDDGGQRFGKYPPGWPAALSLGVYFDAYWIVNAILAGFSVWIVYRLGSKVAGSGVGILSAVLSLTSPMFLMLSGSILSHGFSLFLASAFALAWLDLFPAKMEKQDRKVSPKGLLLTIAGLSLGLLSITRPLTAVGIALPFLIHGLIRLVKGRSSERLHLIGIGGIALFIAGLLPVWQAALTGDPWKNPYTLWWEYDRFGFGPGIGVTESGHNLYWAYWNLRWSLRQGLHDLFGWPFLSWLFLPFGIVALRRNRDGWLLWMSFPALVLVYGAYWVGSWLYGPRYYFESLPGLAITSAAGMAWLGGWLGKERIGAHLRSVLVSIVVLLLLVLNVHFYLPPRLELMNKLNGVSREHLRPFEVAQYERALVIVHPVQCWTEYGTLLTLTAPFNDTGWVLAYSRGQAADTRLASGYGGWPVFHYYPDEPYVFYRNPKMKVIIVQE